MILATAPAGGQEGEKPPGAHSEPFHEFRQQTLEYVGPEDAPPDPDSVGEIVLGWFGPSEPAHALHGDLWVAASLAVEEANASGGWGGLPYRLAPRWSDNVWGTGISQLARLAFADGARAILGSVDSAATHLAEQIVVKARLPLVSPVSSDESVNLAGVPWMFSVVPGDHLWAPTLAESLVSSTGAGDFALVATTDHGSRQAARAVLDEVARHDLAPAIRLDLAPDIQDLAEKLARRDLSGITSVVVAAEPEDGAGILLALRSSGFDGAIFGAPTIARRRCLELAGAAADGVRVPLLTNPSSAEALHAFAALFRQRTGNEPDWAAAHTYDATRLLIEAIERAGLSRTSIRLALLEMSPWLGVTGTIDWDATGQNRRPVTSVGTLLDGKLVTDRETR